MPHTQNIHAQIQYAQKLWDVSTMMNNILKKRRHHAETRGGEKGEEFCGKPKQPTRMLAGLYLFAFYYNVLSL